MPVHSEGSHELIVNRFRELALLELFAEHGYEPGPEFQVMAPHLDRQAVDLLLNPLPLPPQSRWLRTA
jgi:hypothetical protein